jgi:glycerol-3-phosphate acyltransferase PlsY
MGIIESSYENLEVSNLLPSFFKFLFGGALSMENGSLWGIALILTTAMVSFLSFKGFRYEKAMAPSGILTAIVGLLALKAGWINNSVFVLTCIYAVGGIFYLFKERSGEEA